MSKRDPKALFDVTGVGNAIVDVLSFTEEAFLANQDLPKGSMTLVDETRARNLYQKMGQATECSGGSTANTLAGMASLGAKTAFIGKVKSDQLGSIFVHDLHAVGVHFGTNPLENGPSTACCFVYVTPDAQRTMATHLGACSHVSENDIDEQLIENSAVTYIEGYLWDLAPAKAAIRKAVRVARNANKKIALTLSDTFCVSRHRAEFLELIASDIDILFANEAEITSLYDTDDLEVAIAELRKTGLTAAITRGEHGSTVVTKDSRDDVATKSVANLVDTTGAGDLYASGFLYGWANGWALKDCAALGNRCAGEIISQIGARSMKPLNELVHAAA
jgi:sugar/nucleoside kinase (ribokinase family)